MGASIKCTRLICYSFFYLVSFERKVCYRNKTLPLSFSLPRCAKRLLLQLFPCRGVQVYCLLKEGSSLTIKPKALSEPLSRATDQTSAYDNNTSLSIALSIARRSIAWRQPDDGHHIALLISMIVHSVRKPRARGGGYLLAGHAIETMSTN